MKDFFEGVTPEMVGRMSQGICLFCDKKSMPDSVVCEDCNDELAR